MQSRAAQAWALALFWATGICGAAHAAPALMALMTEDELPAAERPRFEALKGTPGVKGLRPVQVNGPAMKDAAPGAMMELALAPGMTVAARTSHTRTLDKGRLLWAGKVMGQGRPDGDVILVMDGSSVTGTVTAPNGRVYRLHPLGQANAVSELDHAGLPPDHAPLETMQEAPAPIAPSLDLSPNAPPTDITLLVAYTAAARSAPGVAIDSLIDLALAESNQGFENSAVKARFRDAARLETGYVERGKSYEQINQDQLTGANGLAAALQARESARADVAVLIVNQPEFCGRASRIGGGAETAFVAVHYNCATGYYSFAHEIGHIAGARHDIENDSTPTPFPYGHGFRNPAQPPAAWRTVMAYACFAGGLVCDPRINYWSNPRASFGGMALGRPDIADNARVWNERAPVMAAFR